MRSRVHILAVVCLAAAADTGAQTNHWRQCLTDISPAAIEACTSIIFLDPRNDGAFVNRGIAYRRIGNIALALRDYDHAVQLNPAAADAFNNRGNAYRDLNEFDRAVRDYDEAIRLNPRYAHAYNNRGVIFLEAGEPGLAAADFSQAIERDARYANAYRNRGLARTDQRLYDLAIADFDQAFRLNPELGHGPEYALALFGRGLVRRRNGDAGGEGDIQQATRLLPGVAEVMAGEGVK
ncbi:MAG: tetratricopeptide repeat protein [Acidobacteria bacterium]|nr:MAG: tetratricopeptide repeat protein [Acidobacteriota bacterium]